MHKELTPIVISVDGEDGSEIVAAQRDSFFSEFEEEDDAPGVRRGCEASTAQGQDLDMDEDEEAIILARPRMENQAQASRAISLGGKPGRAAREAVKGGHGSHIQVSLRLSRETEGTMIVKVVENNSNVRLQDTFSIPIKDRNILLTSRGGQGEDGRWGENGADGIPGPNGDDATRMTDAGDGAPGGHGGRAGSGSDGADGGNGGTVYIQINERNTHLLLAVDWDVAPGDGGKPGQHGYPGQGAPGGQGGAALKWKQFQRMNYICTNACQGDPSLTGQTNNALVPFVSTGNRDRFEVAVNGEVQVKLLRDGETVATTNNIRTFDVNTTSQVPTGVNWQQALIKSVIDSHDTSSAALEPYVRLPSHICKCRGGPTNAHCLGCKKKEVHAKLERPRGRDGQNGVAGQACKTILKSGRKGIPGMGHIVVIDARKQATIYSSKYNIQLIGFEVEDENGDGVFEPGDDIFVSMIRIRNTGGMPTPAFTQIPITVQKTEWIIPYEEDPPVYIPAAIPPGGIAYVQGRIRAFVNYTPKRSPTPSEAFKTVTLVSIKATVPDIDRDVPGFKDFRKEIRLEYPISIENVQFLKCVPQGAQTTIKWTVSNISRKNFGQAGELNRTMGARLSMSKGSKLSIASNGKSTKVVEMPLIGSRSSQIYSETINISPNAEPDTSHQYRLSLYLSIPSPERDIYPLRLIQEKFIDIQIGEGWSKHTKSKYLFVVNESTTNATILRWKSYVRDFLNIEADVFNVSLLGSLYQDDAKTTIFRQYAGKSIVFFCNRFDFFEKKDCTVLDLIPPETIAKETAFRGTTIIFCGALTQTIESKAWLKDFVRPVVAESREEIGGDLQYESMNSFFNTMHERRRAGIEVDSFSTYTIPVQRSNSMLVRRDTQIRKEAKKTVEKLQRELPNSRFSVSVVAKENPENMGSLGVVKIFTGAPRRTSFVATAPGGIIEKMSNSQDETLDKLELFACISALPLQERLQILFPLSPEESPSIDNTTRKGKFFLLATDLSVVYEAQSELVYLFKTFVKHGWSKNISQNDFLNLFPCLDTILSYPVLIGAITSERPKENPFIRLLTRVMRVISSASICGKFTRMMSGLAGPHPEIIRNIIASLEYKLLRAGFDKKQVKYGGKYIKNLCTETFALDVHRETFAEISRLVRLGLTDLQNTLAFSKDLIDTDENPKATIIKPEEVVAKVEKGEEKHKQVEKETEEAVKGLEEMLTLSDGKAKNPNVSRQRKFEFDPIEEESRATRWVEEETAQSFEEEESEELASEYSARFPGLRPEEFEVQLPHHPTDGGSSIGVNVADGYESDGGTVHFKIKVPR